MHGRLQRGPVQGGLRRSGQSRSLLRCLRRLTRDAAALLRKLASVLLQGMIALRRDATEVMHEDFMDAILEVQAKKKATLNYYA